MKHIHPVPGEYNILSREMVYPDAAVAEISERYQLDAGRLAEALDLVVFAYDDAGHWHTRRPHWIDAAALAKTSLTKLRALRRDWNYASEGAKQTIAASFNDYSAEVMLAEIEGMIAVMEDLAEDVGRGRGNPGGARKSDGVDLRVLHGCTDILNTFWQAERGKPLGHEIEYDHYSKPDADGVVKSYAVPKSQGITFLQDCLKHLDDRVSIETCRTLVRAAKRRTKR